MAKKSLVNYLDDEEFYKCIVEYKTKVYEAKKLGKPKPRIPEYAGKCIMKIAQGFSTQHSYVNYPFKQDMIADAVENCIRYFDNFDETRFKKPFSYFNKIIWYAFLRRIAVEKKYLYTKYKIFQKALVLQDILDRQESDERNFDLTPNDMDSDKMKLFINDFEKSLLKKNEKPAKGVEKFVEEENVV